MPQNTAECFDVVACGSRLSFLGTRREGGRLYTFTARSGAARSLSSLKIVRCLFEKYADGDGEEGRDSNTMGYRNSGLRGRKRGTR